MSLLFIDGFDVYGDVNLHSNGFPFGQDISTQLASSGYTAAAGVCCWATTRTGIGACAIFVAGGTNLMRKAFKTSSRVIIGFASLFRPGVWDLLATFGYDNFMGGMFPQMRICKTALGAITATTGDDTPVEIATTDPNVVFPDVWHYIEIDYSPDNANGTVSVRVDGGVVLSISGVRTTYKGMPSSVNYIDFSWTNNSASLVGEGFTYWRLLDDLYICNAEGTNFNAFLGDCVVHSVMPAADAGTNQMGQFGGTVGHYTAVSESIPDEDNSYLYTNQPNLTELFTLNELPTDIIDVLAVAVNVRAKKDSAGITTYSAVASYEGHETDGTANTMTTVYQTKQLLMSEKPGGGSWTKTDIPNLQIGFRTGS